jgi:hypothetical protein
VPDPKISVEDLASSPLVHRNGDFFAPPGLTNFLGTTQVDNDLVALRHTTFPPFGGLGHTITARGYVDGRLITAYGEPVTFRWRPDRVTRTATLGGLEIVTTTVAVPGEQAVVVDIAVRSVDGAAREVSLKLGFDANVTQAARAWTAAETPGEWDNEVVLDVHRGRVVFRARHSEAVSMQGLDTADVTMLPRGVEVALAVPAGGTARVAYVQCLAASEDAAQEAYDRVAADVPAVLAASEAMWDRELAAMFTPGNDSFSGSLPWLETDNAALRRLYLTGAVGVLYHRRDSPHSVVGRAYDTLMPRYWQTLTCIWETSLSSLTHALLDPDVLRRHLERWMATDVHTHFGTEWLTGSTAGNWYSVNDYALTHLVRDLVAWTGGEEWLSTVPAGDPDGRTVLDHVHRFATAYRELQGDHGLADYGGDINTFLECVSTYNHAIAALNAGAVYCLRTAAELDPGERSAGYADEADLLAARVNDLYVRGGGYWNVRHPDGSLVPVRHCYDFITVPRAMGGDLDEAQRREMAEFFVRELQTPTWMHALSPYDDDALFSVRPDHQWNGAYPAWPSEAVAALYALGADDVAAGWLEGLARSANQGPFGQAQFAEVAYAPDAGGARKSPPEFPWINDWADSSTGSYVSMVIEAIFGVRVGVDGAVTATPRLQGVDPGARLRDLVIRGRRYDVDASGIHPVD